MMTDPRKNGDLHEPATAPATPWTYRKLKNQSIPLSTPYAT